MDFTFSLKLRQLCETKIALVAFEQGIEKYLKFALLFIYKFV